MLSKQAEDGKTGAKAYPLTLKNSDNLFQIDCPITFQKENYLKYHLFRACKLE